MIHLLVGAAKSLRRPAPEMLGYTWDTLMSTFVSSSGEIVTPDSAMTIGAVWGCVRVLSESLATFPLKVYRRLPNGGKIPDPNHPLYEVLHDEPNPWQTSFEFREMMQAHLCLRGNAYALIVPGRRGAVDQLLPLHPDIVTVERLENGRLRYIVRYTESGGRFREEKYSQDQIFHLRGLSLDGMTGVSVVKYARDTLGYAKTMERHGQSFFKNGARPGVVFETDQPMRVNVAKALKEEWDREHAGSANSGKTAIMPFGLKAKMLGMTNEDSQFLESRKFQKAEIASWFRVPPHLIGDLEKATYSNIEQQSLDFITYTMLPWLTRWQQKIGRELITDQDHFAEFVTLDLLRADATARANFYTSLANIGVFTVNEIRTIENMNQIGPDGDKRLVQLNMTTLDKAGETTEAPPAPEPVEQEETVEEQSAVRQAVESLRIAYEINAEKLREIAQRSESLSGQLVDVTNTASRTRELIQAEIDKTKEELLLNGQRVEQAISEAVDRSAKLLVDLEGKSVEATELSARLGDATEAARSLIRETFGRLQRLETDGIRRAARKSNFLAEMEDFYADHSLRLSEALSGPVLTYGALVRQNISADLLSARYVERSKAILLEVAGACTQDRLASEVEAGLATWPDRIGEFLSWMAEGSTDDRMAESGCE